MNWKPTVAQNEIEHHSQQKIGETAAPKHDSENGSHNMGKRPKHPVREEELTPNSKMHGNTYPISLREDEQTSA